MSDASDDDRPSTGPPDRQTLRLLERRLADEPLVAETKFEPDSNEPRVLEASVDPDRNRTRTRSSDVEKAFNAIAP